MSTIPPPAPNGYLAIREAVSDNTQVTHLARTGLHLPTDGPTLCGLRRFDLVVDGRVVEPADITWTTGPGHVGPGVAQAHCSACLDALTTATEIEQLEAAITGAFTMDITEEGAAAIQRLLDAAETPTERPTLDELQDQVEEWTQRFHIDGGPDPLADALAIAEEAGEVARAVLKRAHGHRPDTDWEAQLYAEIGDLVIAVLSLTANEGWNLTDIVTARWAEVSQR